MMCLRVFKKSVTLVVDATGVFGADHRDECGDGRGE